MNNVLKNNLEYLLDGVPSTNLDIASVHVYLHEFQNNQNQEIIDRIDKIRHDIKGSNYLVYPFLMGYDTLVNKMHNYHCLVPEIVSLQISSIEDLFMMHEILTFINKMMYDEYDQIRKKYQQTLVDYAKMNSSSLLDLLIKMSVSMKFVNVSLLSLLSKAKTEDQLLNSLHHKYDDILNKKGMYDLYML